MPALLTPLPLPVAPEPPPHSFPCRSPNGCRQALHFLTFSHTGLPSCGPADAGLAPVTNDSGIFATRRKAKNRSAGEAEAYPTCAEAPQGLRRVRKDTWKRSRTRTGAGPSAPQPAARSAPPGPPVAAVALYEDGGEATKNHREACTGQRSRSRDGGRLQLEVGAGDRARARVQRLPQSVTAHPRMVRTQVRKGVSPA